MAESAETKAFKKVLRGLPPDTLDAYIADVGRNLEAGKKVPAELRKAFSSSNLAQIKAATTAAGKEQAFRNALETIGVRSELRLAEKGAMPVRIAEGEIAAGKLRATATLEGIEKVETRIRDTIKRDRFSVPQVRKYIEALPTQTHPEAIFIQGDLETMLNTEVDKRLAETRANLNSEKIRHQPAVELAEKMTQETGEIFPRREERRKLEGKQKMSLEGRQTVLQVQRLEHSERGRTRFLAEAEPILAEKGFKLGADQAVQRLTEPMLGASKGLPETQMQFKTLLEKAAGQPGTPGEGGKPGGPRVRPQPAGAVAGVPGALAPAKAGPGKFRGKLMGGAGLLMLIPLLQKLLGGGGQQEELPMPLQVQMMQQMAEAQQQQQGAQSLATSREASAAKNMAQADLIRLQMMQLAGGPAPAVV